MFDELIVATNNEHIGKAVEADGGTAMKGDSSEVKKIHNLMSSVDPISTRVVNIIDRRIPIPPRKYESQIRSLYAALGEYDVDRFDVGLNPVSTKMIDPSKITNNTGRAWKPWNNRRQFVGRVMDGDWHTSVPSVPEYAKPYPKRFTDMVVYESFKAHFNNNIKWEDTLLYDRWMENASSDDVHTPSYADSSEVKKRLEYMDHLYRKIKQDGYKSQLEMATRGTGYLDAILNEVNIDIGPMGEPLFVDGRHRLCIAKLLNIDKIPVFVLVRHREWMSNVKEQGNEETLFEN